MADTPMARPLVIVGAGGFGREVLDVVEAIAAQPSADSSPSADASGSPPSLRFVGFVDDAPQHLDRLDARGAALLSGMDDPAAAGACYLIGVASPAARRSIERRATDAGWTPTSVRHPRSTFGAADEVGPGLVACANAIVTTNVTIGRHVHLNLGVTVGHDAVLGDFVTIHPGANISGDVHLGDDVTVGTGSAIIQGVTVGTGTTIGAGSVVTRDLPEGVIAVGAPAKPIRAAD